jgi:succinylglutamic semialdehyde dehydrogenase
VHLIEADHDSDYTRQEIFGPDLAITIVDNEDEACRVINASPFGLSLAVFSASRDTLDAVYRATRAGCVNWNRSTSRATGALPFGGVGRSGNYRPAGADAFRNVTYPVQLQWTAPTGGDHD